MEKEGRHCIQDWVFTWDAKKARKNIEDHDGVSFEEACEVFFDRNYVMLEDVFAEGEQRWLLTGYSERKRLLTVVVTEIGETTWRIISAWEATRKERREYEDDS